MIEVTQFFQQHIWASKLIWSIVGLVIAMLLTSIINRTLHKKIHDSSKFYAARKITYYTISIIYVIVMLFVWLEVAGSFTTYVGLLSAGIAVALKDVFSNVAAWLFIMIRKPFSVGDRILIKDQRGDVIDVRLFQFSLIEVSAPEDGEQSTGRIVDIPNHYVWLYPVINYVKGFEYIWNEVRVEVTFESDWQLAKTLLSEIANKHALHLSEKAEAEVKKATRRYMIYFNKLTPIVYTDVGESGVIFTLRYLCTPKMKRQTTNDIWEDVLHLISVHDTIDLAYPTRRSITS